MNKLTESMTNPGKQQVYYKSMFEYGEEKIRIRINLDSYANQCSATADIYDPGARKWNEIARIMPDNMNLVRSEASPYSKSLGKEAFLPDEKALLDEVGLIL